MICHLQHDSNHRKELLRSTPHWSIPPFNNWDICMFTQTSQCVFTRLCQCHLELERTSGPSSFYLGYFSLSKNFNHFVKDASSILSWAIALGLTTSQLPPFQNTPPITTTNLLQAVGFWHGEILISSSSYLAIL